MIALLAAAHGLVEVNSRLRSDQALHQAFGRTACAEQSVREQTLDACTTENVQQMQQALAQIYRQHSQGFQHDYQQRLQVLDADMSGLPCEKKAAFATKGYFARQRNRQGRQLGRVVASHYDEVVVDQVFAGTTQLVTALPTLMVAAEQTLELDVAKRARTIVRIDAGGGSLDDPNWLLSRSYQVMAKDYSSTRAAHLAASVVRCRKKNGQWGMGVLISTIDPSTIVTLTELSLCEWVPPDAELLAYVYFYDGRGGGVEATLKGDKQSLGLTKRTKRRFAAQQMVVLLSALAHNVIVWARCWLAPHEPKVRRYGMKRMVRDVFHLSGFLVRNARGHLVEVVLNQRAPLVRGLSRSLDVLLRPSHIAVNWGQV